MPASTLSVYACPAFSHACSAFGHASSDFRHEEGATRDEERVTRGEERVTRGGVEEGGAGISMAGMSVREAEPADIDEICALIEEHARYEGNETLTLDRSEMSGHLFCPDPKAWVLIAEPAGRTEVAGFAFCSWNFSTWAGRPGIWLDDLYVRPSYRGQGLGQGLLNALRARTTGRVEWDMQAGNAQAERFYRKLGAEPVTGWIRYRWSPEADPET